MFPTNVRERLLEIIRTHHPSLPGSWGLMRSSLLKAGFAPNHFVRATGKLIGFSPSFSVKMPLGYVRSTIRAGEEFLVGEKRFLVMVNHAKHHRHIFVTVRLF